MEGVMALDLDDWILQRKHAAFHQKVELERELGRTEGRLGILQDLEDTLRNAHENEDLDTVDSGNKNPNPKIGKVDICSPGAQFPDPGKYSDGIADTENAENPVIVGGKYARVLS